MLADGVGLTEFAAGGRTAGTFNNPNQLGYFAVCCISQIYLLLYHRVLGYKLAFGLITLSVFMAVASLSKAAILASFLVYFLALKPVSTSRPAAGWLLLSGGSMAVLGVAYNLGRFDRLLFIRRLQGASTESDSSLASRGYFEIFGGNPAELLFGFGANGVLDRVGHEVHSTMAGVLNTYGILGLGVFAAILVVWIVRLGRSYGRGGPSALQVQRLSMG